MEDKFLDRYFGKIQQTPDELKEEFKTITSANTQPGVVKLIDQADRASTVYNGQKRTYLVNHYNEMQDDMPAGKTEISYQTEDGTFINVSERFFLLSKGEAVTHSGFSVNSEGAVTEFSSEQVKDAIVTASAAIEDIVKMQQGAVPSEE